MSAIWIARISYAIACASGLAWAALEFGLSGALLAVCIIAVSAFVTALHDLY